MTAEKPVPRRRRWWRRLLYVLAGLAIVAFLINGVFFRLGVGYGLRKILGGVGLEAQCEVEGTLLSELVLRDLVVRGTTAANRTDLRADFILVDYSWSAWMSEGLASFVERLQVKRLEGTFDVAALPKKDEPDSEKGVFPLNRLPQPTLALEDIDLAVLLEGDQRLIVRDLEWRLSPDDPTSELRLARLELPGGYSMEDIAIGTTYTANGLRLTGWEIHPQVNVERVEISLVDRDAEGDTVTDNVSASVLQIDGDVALFGARLGVEATLNEEARLEWQEGSLDLAKLGEELLPDAELSGEVTGVTATIDNMGEPLEQWSAELQLEGNDWRYRQWRVAKVGFDATLEEGEVTSVLQVDLDEENGLKLEAETALPQGGADEDDDRLVADGRLTVTAPRVQDWVDQSELPLRLASLDGGFEFRYAGDALQMLEGTLTAQSVGNDDWRASQLVLRSVPVSSDGAGSPNQIRILLSATAGAAEAVEAEVLLGLNDMVYNGTMAVDVENLARWQVPHPEREGWSPLEGAVQVKWEGEGDLRDSSHEGHAEATVRNVAPARQPMEHQGELALDYTMDAVSVNSLTWRKDDFEFAANGRYTPDGIRLPEIRVRKGEESWLEGHIFVPLAPEGPIDQRFWESGEALDVELHSSTLSLQRLAQVFAPERESLQGTLKIDVTAKGPPEALVAEVQVTGRDLGASVPEDRPLSADVDVRVAVRDQHLRVDGAIKQKDLAPIELTGGMPFSWQALDQLQSTPIDFRLRCESTPLNFLPEYVPAVTAAQGNLGMDVAVTGTVSDPVVNGMVNLNVPVLRLKTPTVPEVRDARIYLQSDGKRLDIQTFKATLAGGKIDLGGDVLFGEEGPELDLRLQMEQAPLIRNENMIVRANGDLRVSGPLASASLGGVVTVAESRYFREFELLPTNAPTPSVPTAPRQIEKYYGTEKEPFRDWTIDVKIQTPPNDPFRVRSNLAALDIALDLNLLGKGSRVFPRGQVAVVDGYAKLPFSQLDFGPSTIGFDEASGFPGRLSISGQATVQEYAISINVGGTLNDVQPLLTSSPPLPDEEIMTLLATGTTREALLGDENLAASRAAMLLFDKLWQKLNPDDELKDPAEMRERRLTVEPAQVNARTGKQVSSARLRLTDRFSLSADADVEGDMRGLLHYFFRF